MIFLDKETEKFMELEFPNIKVKREKIIIKKGDNLITIPSELYPIQNRKRLRLFAYSNTAPNQNELEVARVFDEMEFPSGHCYSNTLNFIDRLLKQEVSDKDIEPYVGWIVINGIPIHHCWAVYKEIQEKGITNIDQQREILADYLIQEKSKPNSETRTFGQVLPIYIYVGSKASPLDGASLFRKLMDTYPNHPSYSSSGMNGNGMSKTQKLIYDKLENR